MKRTRESWVLYLLFGFPFLLVLFILGLRFIPCGLGSDCAYASAAQVYHTPIPTFVPATLPASGVGADAEVSQKCTTNAKTLLGAWVSSGYSEAEPFEFTDLRGTVCEATFKDVEPLFKEGNLWYSGALACASCHNSEIETSSARLDLSSYAGILAGSQRASADAQGNDILGGGNWEQSMLHEMLFVTKEMPLGRPPNAVPEEGPTLQAGQAKPQ